MTASRYCAYGTSAGIVQGSADDTDHRLSQGGDFAGFRCDPAPSSSRQVRTEGAARGVSGPPWRLCQHDGSALHLSPTRWSRASPSSGPPSRILSKRSCSASAGYGCHQSGTAALLRRPHHLTDTCRPVHACPSPEPCYSARDRAVEAQHFTLDVPEGTLTMRFTQPNKDEPVFSIDTAALGRIESFPLTVGYFDDLAKSESDTSTAFMNSLIAAVGKRPDSADLASEDVARLSEVDRNEFARRFFGQQSVSVS